MESFLIKALQLVVALSLLVIIHEFGHFLWARLYKIRVEKFYLFFNPWWTPFKWKPKNSDTEYGIGWLPLGGYVKIAGMIDESMDKDQMAQPPKPDEFRVKPAWQRLLVMAGGVLNNFILAIIIYAGIAWYWGEKTIPYENAYEGMDFSKEAVELGFRKGDILLAANGQKIDQTDRGHLFKVLESNTVTVLRNHTDTVVINLPKNAIERIDPEHGFMAYRVPVFVKNVISGEPAAKAGIMENDRIIAVGDSLTPSYTELVPALTAYAGRQTDIGLMRNGQPVTVKATPDDNGKLGFQLMAPDHIFVCDTTRYGFFQSFPVGISDGTDMLVTYVGSLKMLFTKAGAQSIGGFGAIGNMFPPKWDWRTFWEMTAFLSIILAFMNVLPIPALDGGHIMFTFYEVVTRRKLPDAFLEKAQMAGMLFLIALLIYANFNDIYRFIIK